MDNDEVMRLLLAAKVRELANSMRKHKHMHIDDTAQFEKAVAADPIEPYVDLVLQEFRRIAARF